MIKTLLSQRPGENFLASGDKLKEPNANGDGKPLAFNEWGFRLLFFIAQKSSGMAKSSVLFPSGDEGSCSFPMGMKFQVFFITRDKFLADFFSGEGPTGSVIQECIKPINPFT